MPPGIAETGPVPASRLKKGAPMQLRILDDEAAQATVKLPVPAVGLLLRSKRWRAAMR
jgi:hypothetical protein